MLEFARGKLIGTVLADPEKIVAQGVAIEVGAGSHVQVESTFFTDLRKGMQLAAHSEDLSLDDLRRHFGPLPAGGVLKLAATASGPYKALAIEGRTAAQGARFMDLSLGDLTTKVAFDTASMRLAFTDVHAHKDRSSYRGRIAVDFSSSAMPVDAHVELSDAYVNDLVDLAVGLVPELSTVEDPDLVDGHVEGVIDVKGPVAAPSGTASLELDDLILWGESFNSGMARLSLHGGDPRLQIDELVLLHGEAALRVAGRFGPRWQLDIDGRTENFTLADLDIEGGSLAAAFDVHGSLLRWRESAGTMTLSQLRIVRSDLAFENDGPAQVTFGPEGIRTERLALRAPFTTAQLSGGRGRDGRLDLRLGASIDGRVLPGLMPDVEHASGTYLVQAVVGGSAK